MNWNDLENLWRNQAACLAGPAPSAAALADTFRRRARRLFWRDTIEAGAGFAVAAFFALMAWRIGALNVGTVGGIATVIALGGFFVRERLRVRRRRPAFDAPLRHHVEAEIAEVLRQIALLRQVFWWYLLPCGVAVALYLGGLWWAMPPHVRAGAMGFLGWYAAAVVALYAGIWWLNQRTVRLTFEPQLRELEAIRDELDRAA